MATRGLEVNLEKTKVMVTGEGTNHIMQSGRWPSGCCGSGVGVKSILSKECNKWCHVRYSGLRSVNGVENFQCPTYRGG